MKDKNFIFANQQVHTNLVVGTDTISTNVYDAGAAIKLFEGGSELDLCVEYTTIGGTTPKFRAWLVGADDAAGTTNPIILADTGLTDTIVAGDLPVLKRMRVGQQRTAKRYYVLFVESGGGGNDCDTTVNAFLAVAGGQQTNLRP